LEKYEKEVKELGYYEQEEDVLSYALFPKVAPKFFEARKEAKYSASITEKEDGHCTIRCTVKGLDSELFCLDLGTPDRLTAELVKKQFILKGNEIYQMLINKLTEEEK